MLLWHIMLLPFIVGLLTVWHLILVRRHGVVPPFDAQPPKPPPPAEAEAELADTDTASEIRSGGPEPVQVPR
jgi:quinol-cytochrome oxidoreductase complex cytochrome b subunit